MVGFTWVVVVTATFQSIPGQQIQARKRGVRSMSVAKRCSQAPPPFSPRCLKHYSSAQPGAEAVFNIPFPAFAVAEEKSLIGVSRVFVA